jgi:hypothetical protein
MGAIRLTPGTPSADSLAMLINTSGETVVFPGGRSEADMVSPYIIAMPPSTPMTWPVMYAARRRRGMRRCRLFLRVCGARERYQLEGGFRVPSGHGFQNFGIYKPGRNGVDGDFARRHLARQGFGEGDLSAFGGGVIGLPGVAHLPGHRSNVDDAPVRLRIMCFTAAFEQLKVLFKLVLMTASQSASGIIMMTISRVMPALLTRMCRSPKVSTANLTNASACFEVGHIRLDAMRLCRPLP